MVTASTLAIAGPASASFFGGTLTCPASTKVIGYGYKGNVNSMLIKAPGPTAMYSGTYTGYWEHLVGWYSSGSWSVQWAGATNGYGACGTS